MELASSSSVFAPSSSSSSNDVTAPNDHELRSQIEERRIRSDAAYEEAKRKEKASHEEKLRQEKAKAESEAGLDEAKRAALEAERRATKEAAERLTSETSTRVVARVAQEDVGLQMNANAGTSSKVLWAAESNLNFEQARLHKFKEVDERNQALRLTYNKDLSSYEKLIKRSINQIRRSTKVVSEKACEIVKIFHDPHCPQSVGMAAFAKKVLSYCISPENDAFACAYVIVLVTSQVPHAMDLLLAELHRACIYTRGWWDAGFIGDLVITSAVAGIEPPIMKEGSSIFCQQPWVDLNRFSPLSGLGFGLEAEVGEGEAHEEERSSGLVDCDGDFQPDFGLHILPWEASGVDDSDCNSGEKDNWVLDCEPLSQWEPLAQDSIGGSQVTESGPPSNWV
nr:protein GLE1-like [Quercus suber]